MSLKARIGKLERDGEPPGRLTFGRMMEIIEGAAPTPAEALHLADLEREWAAASAQESVEEQLARLIAEIPS